jgi:hypothetical protein
MDVFIDRLFCIVQDGGHPDTAARSQMNDAATLKPAKARSASKPRAKPATKPDTWQAEKSQMTRTSILEATLQCLVQVGYAQTTTEKIASQAGISRGAMTHHFKSRAMVFNAVAKYIVEKHFAGGVCTN